MQPLLYPAAQGVCGRQGFKDHRGRGGEGVCQCSISCYVLPPAHVMQLLGQLQFKLVSVQRHMKLPHNKSQGNRCQMTHV
jgi:hypothetical protein